MSPTRSSLTPAWAKQAVWYQIFPERFWNADPTNDPRLEDQAGAWPHDLSGPWQVHPWTSDWYEMLPYERQNGRGIWHNLQRRRYGGDLQGILDRLDYLQDLGVSALYLNPVFTAPSAHKYDGACYHHIDPTFGPDPHGDRRLAAQEDPADPATWVWTSADRLLLRLVAEVHRRGMRIILDGVFNHMGLNSFAYQDLRLRQRGSKFVDWFTPLSWDDPAAGTRFACQGWADVDELPELRKVDADIAPGPKAYIDAATRRWMDPDADGDPQDGIDGWRLDVAYCIGHAFWEDWRRFVKAINPQAYLTGELFWTLEEVQPYLQGDEFDGMMNYQLAYACAEFFIQDGRRISASEFDGRLKELRDAFPGEINAAMQNLFGSHDTNRLGSHIVNRGWADYRNWITFCEISGAGRNAGYETRKPTAAERRLQKLYAIFQMTYLGAPMIYYGDEAGMWGANDPCCRKPMLWPELDYAAEAYLPNGERRAQPDPVAFDHELFAHYQTLIRIRRGTPALLDGDFTTLLVDEAPQIYAFRRQGGGQTAVVVLNRGDTQAVVRLQGVEGVWADLLEPGRSWEAQQGALQVEVNGLWGRVLLKQAQA
jgi:glycosidase